MNSNLKIRSARFNTISNALPVKIAIIITIILFAISNLQAQVTWDGSESDDWNTAANWDTGSVPTSSDNVLIPAIANTNYKAPTIASGESHEVNNLTIELNGRVEIGPLSGGTGSNLTVNGTLDNEGLLRANDDSSLILLGTYTTNGNGTFANSRVVYGDLSYSIFSVPFTDGSIALFNGVYAYAYNNDTGEFVALDYSESTVPGKGYFIAIDGGFGNETFGLGFSGSPVGEDVYVAVSTGTHDNFNLVGNPYTAAISVSEFLAHTNNSNNTTGVIYFWDDGGSNSGGSRAGDFITVNAIGTVGTNNLGDGVSGVKGTSVYNGHVTTMQGFYVEATNDDYVAFTQDMQVAGNNASDNFYRLDNTTEYTKIKLSLDNGKLSDELLIAFASDATEYRDYSMDATKMHGIDGISLYANYKQESYAILALPVLEGEELMIDLGLEMSESTNHTLNLDELINFPGEYTLWLQEVGSDITYNLLETSSIPVAKGSTYTLRFQPAEVLGVTPKNTFSILSANTEGLILGNLTQGTGITIHDAAGRVYLEDFFQPVANQIQIDLPLARHQLYLITVGDETLKFMLN